jgi:hypothetical protein
VRWLRVGRVVVSGQNWRRESSRCDATSRVAGRGKRAREEAVKVSAKLVRSHGFLGRPVRRLAQGDV